MWAHEDWDNKTTSTIVGQMTYSKAQNNPKHKSNFSVLANRYVQTYSKKVKETTCEKWKIAIRFNTYDRKRYCISCRSLEPINRVGMCVKCAACVVFASTAKCMVCKASPGFKYNDQTKYTCPKHFFNKYSDFADRKLKDATKLHEKIAYIDPIYGPPKSVKNFTEHDKETVITGKIFEQSEQESKSQSMENVSELSIEKHKSASEKGGSSSSEKTKKHKLKQKEKKEKKTLKEKIEAKQQELEKLLKQLENENKKNTKLPNLPAMSVRKYTFDQNLSIAKQNKLFGYYCHVDDTEKLTHYFNKSTDNLYFIKNAIPTQADNGHATLAFARKCVERRAILTSFDADTLVYDMWGSVRNLDLGIGVWVNRPRITPDDDSRADACVSLINSLPDKSIVKYCECRNLDECFVTCKAQWSSAKLKYKNINIHCNDVTYYVANLVDFVSNAFKILTPHFTKVTFTDVFNVYPKSSQFSWKESTWKTTESSVELRTLKNNVTKDYCVYRHTHHLLSSQVEMGWPVQNIVFVDNIQASLIYLAHLSDHTYKAVVRFAQNSDDLPLDYTQSNITVTTGGESGSFETAQDNKTKSFDFSPAKDEAKINGVRQFPPGPDPGKEQQVAPQENTNTAPIQEVQYNFYSLEDMKTDVKQMNQGDVFYKTDVANGQTTYYLRNNEEQISCRTYTVPLGTTSDPTIVFRGRPQSTTVINIKMLNAMIIEFSKIRVYSAAAIEEFYSAMLRRFKNETTMDMVINLVPLLIRQVEKMTVAANVAQNDMNNTLVNTIRSFGLTQQVLTTFQWISRHCIIFAKRVGLSMLIGLASYGTRAAIGYAFELPLSWGSHLELAVFSGTTATLTTYMIFRGWFNFSHNLYLGYNNNSNIKMVNTDNQATGLVTHYGASRFQ